MSENKKPFWSGIPGLVTGLAGLLTGVVGLITLLVQLDVIGGDKTSDRPKENTAVGSATTAVGAPTTVGGSSGTVPTTQATSFTVTPKLAFGPTDPKEQMVMVRNTSASDLKVTGLPLTGADKDRFVPTYGDCATPLKPNAVCNLKVTFTPSGPLKNYSATLQVNAQGAPTQQVELTASTIL